MFRTSIGPEGTAAVDGFEITKEVASWTKVSKKVFEIKFTPFVIEPSFGTGRILYSLLEHSFYQRQGDEQWCVMQPTSCSAKVCRLSNKECNLVVDEIANELMENDLATRESTGQPPHWVAGTCVPMSLDVDGPYGDSLRTGLDEAGAPFLKCPVASH
jgi:glycyl-tRNA synthetase (class II)